MVHRLVATFALVLLLVASAVPAFAQSSGCQFVLGFKAIHDAIPTVVGNCLDNEHPAGAGEEQHTANGLMAWRKADNWTAFTDGYRTWVNGPNGIQERLNTQRFAWEHDPAVSTSLSCAAGDQNCALAQTVLPRPEEAPAGFTLSSEWESHVPTGPSYNAKLVNDSQVVTVQVEPRADEYGDKSANQAYVSTINPGDWHQVRPAPQLGYSADEYINGNEIHYGWRNKNVFVLLDIANAASTDVSWLMPMGHAMQSRLAALIGAEAPENVGASGAPRPQPLPVPQPSAAQAQPAPAPQPAAPPHRYVVFVGGYDSTTASTAANFLALSSVLVSQFGYSDGDLMRFSYTGFDVGTGGYLAPRLYSPCDTEGHLSTNIQKLQATISELAALHPGAGISVVGHSMGGLMAYMLPSYGFVAPLSSVVAIDSPLNGVTGLVSLAGALVNCGPIATDLGALRVDPSAYQYLQSDYSAMHRMGGKVGVVVNENDCMYFWGMCEFGFGTDDRVTEWAPNDWHIAPTVGDPSRESILQSHEAIMADYASMEMVAAFIGRQGQ